MESYPICLRSAPLNVPLLEFRKPIVSRQDRLDSPLCLPGLLAKAGWPDPCQVNSRPRPGTRVAKGPAKGPGSTSGAPDCLAVGKKGIHLVHEW